MRFDSAPGGREEEVHAISEDAVLLSSLVDAFAAIMIFLSEVVKEIFVRGKPVRVGEKALKWSKIAKDLLQKAKEELIVEASGVSSGEHIGPVLTPEAILIMHLERLVCGVHGNGNINIISMLEACQERLVRSTIVELLQ